ncbi:homocysteine S-methyltransferase family protein [Desulfosediminicola flagellatus]|uniref:homocysteine S-methyltransferase family protein n=1 Tax=Desulfosediminicola flagellatus TaxID=2569541 RepID=UPI0010AC4579|nr:homocysteine S-methyltransferase family protein [Desulfosediminicola flagellatus]
MEKLKPRLRSGETVVNAVRASVDIGLAAILFNCSQPDVMSPAIATALSELHHLGAVLPIVRGCCGIGQEHIAALHTMLN